MSKNIKILDQSKWPKFSSTAITDKIEFWLMVLLCEAFFILQASWTHQTTNEWLWLACVAGSVVRVWLLKFKMEKEMTIILSSNEEENKRVISLVSSFVKGRS